MFRRIINKSTQASDIEEAEKNDFEDGRRPQDDVPTERIIHYIVKDYRRMYNSYDDLRARVRRAEEKVKNARERNATLTRQNERLQAQFVDEKGSRENIGFKTLYKVIHKLDEQLKEARRQNRLLAQAVIADNKNYNLCPSNFGSIFVETSSGKSIIDHVSTQLEKALIKLGCVEGKLDEYEDTLEKIVCLDENSTAKAMLEERVKNAFRELSAAYSHIENSATSIAGIASELSCNEEEKSINQLKKEAKLEICKDSDFMVFKDIHGNDVLVEKDREVLLGKNLGRIRLDEECEEHKMASEIKNAITDCFIGCMMKYMPSMDVMMVALSEAMAEQLSSISSAIHWENEEVMDVFRHQVAIFQKKNKEKFQEELKKYLSEHPEEVEK